MQGTIFDMQQLTVQDGPGVRTTVFLEGCPLRCQWCHNPEGLSPAPQLMASPNGCTHCGRCREVCPSPSKCVACGQCIAVCPAGLRRIAGRRMEARELADLLLKDRAYLTALGGGVTFSGGEPTMQGAFLLEVVSLLQGMHCAIETCGYCDQALFAQLLEKLDYFILDVKLADDALHRHYTGVSNTRILANLAQLKRQRKPFRVRIPLLPGANDTVDNLRRTAALLQDAPALEGVELLRYHQTAGAKYEMVGLPYAPEFDQKQPPNADCTPFERLQIPCRIL